MQDEISILEYSNNLNKTENLDNCNTSYICKDNEYYLSVLVQHDNRVQIRKNMDTPDENKHTVTYNINYIQQTIL
jgi:hypothetical protein